MRVERTDVHACLYSLMTFGAGLVAFGPML